MRIIHKILASVLGLCATFTACTKQNTQSPTPDTADKTQRPVAEHSPMVALYGPPPVVEPKFRPNPSDNIAAPLYGPPPMIAPQPEPQEDQETEVLPAPEQPNVELPKTDDNMFIALYGVRSVETK